MKILKLILKNMLQHKLRTLLTVVGISIAVLAYGLLRTVLSAWDLALEATSPNRLITRHSVSFIFPLPLAYMDRIATIPGVKRVSHATWFQGIFIDEQQFFPRLAVDPETFFDLYPEYQVPPDQYETFLKERNSCVLGVKIARKYNIKIGDVMTITGDIYPGEHRFVVRGIYTGRDKITDETQMFFHWDYLDESVREVMPTYAGMVGWYLIRIDDPSRAATISEQVDAFFKNSAAETKTETEAAFTQGFISMSSAIITAMEFISYIIIGIILLVLANTMVMTARERTVEYAVLKTLGFRSHHIAGLIIGESLAIAIAGGALGMFLTFPMVAGIGEQLSNFFPVFVIENKTLLTAFGFALLVGVLASLFPIQRAMTTKIVDGLRHVG